jgi:hypothetical protein
MRELSTDRNSLNAFMASHVGRTLKSKQETVVSNWCCYMIAKDIALRYLKKAEEKIKGTPAPKCFYGQSIGILMLDTRLPRIPGDVGNATTFPFPVRFKVMEGIHHEAIVCTNPDVSVCHRLVEKAKELEAEGVKAITTSCGYFSIFQDELAEAVEVPAFSSSLIQVPIVSKMLGKHKRVGIICADAQALTKTHLTKAGIDDSMLVAVAGFGKNWSMVRGQDPQGRLNGFEKGLSKVAKELIANNPDIGALVLECTNFPPGASAVQKATGLPVFDIITLTCMIHDALVRKRFIGYM